MDGRTPNLFVIGAPKAGTTFVHHALALVPDVYMSPVKEPGFFSSSRDYRLGLDYYLDGYFPGARGYRLRGESTPWYLYSDEARERIAALPWVDPPTFLVFARQPSARALSMYADLFRTRREPRSFEDAIEAELDGLARGELEPDVRKRYVWCGRYAEHIDRWQASFGAERVHIGVFEDLIQDPTRVWAELAASLGGDLGPSRFAAVSERDRNYGGRLRWPRLDALVRSFEGRNNAVIEGVKRKLPGRHRRVLQRIGRLNRTPTGGPEIAPSPEVMGRIDEYCRSDTERLEGMLGHPLSAWRQPSEPPPGPSRR